MEGVIAWPFLPNVMAFEFVGQLGFPGRAIFWPFVLLEFLHLIKNRLYMRVVRRWPIAGFKDGRSPREADCRPQAGQRRLHAWAELFDQGRVRVWRIFRYRVDWTPWGRIRNAPRSPLPIGDGGNFWPTGQPHIGASAIRSTGSPPRGHANSRAQPSMILPVRLMVG